MKEKRKSQDPNYKEDKNESKVNKSLKLILAEQIMEEKF
jgi:hypothetical protein